MQSFLHADGRLADDNHPGDGSGENGDNLRKGAAPCYGHERGRASNDGAYQVRAERTKHAHHGGGNYGYRGSLQPVQSARDRFAVSVTDPRGEKDHQQGRGQRESAPGRHSAPKAAARDSDQKAILAAGGFRAEVA